MALKTVFSFTISSSTRNKVLLEHVCLARFNQHKIKLDFHFGGQNALKLSKRFVLMGFLQTHESTPKLVNFISTSRKGIVSKACPTSNSIFLGWAFNR